MTDLMIAIVRNTRSPSPFEGSLPPTLPAVLDRCLAGIRAERFASARELHEQLRIVRGHSQADLEATKARTELAFALPRAPRARQRAALLFGAFLLVALLGGGAFLSLRRSDAPLVVPGDHKSKIVVLPFENLGTAEDVYFAAGMTEEITSRLTGIRQLGVISRTSALQYEPGTRSIEQIGRELGVDYVLEGSVRWDHLPDGRNRVRVTPQLIRVEGDVHLWSERYDRVLDDLFAVQSEIARAVIDQLNVQLVPAEQAAFDQQLAQIPTTNLEAYQSYLRGRDQAWLITSREQADQATLLLERAVELDPKFVLAWCALADAHAQVYHWGLDPSSERAQQARRAVERATALAADSSDVHRTRGFVLYWTQHDYTGGLREFDEAIALAPNDVRAREGRAFIKRRQGHFVEAIAEMRQLVELSPRDGRAWRELGVTATYLRRFDEAEKALDQAIQLSQDPLMAYLSLSRVFWLQGDLPTARNKLMARPLLEHDLPHWYLYWQEVYEGHLDAALGELDKVRGSVINWSNIFAPVSALRAQALAWQGKIAEARKEYERALALIDERLAVHPEDARLHALRSLVLAGLEQGENAAKEIAKAQSLAASSGDYVASMDVLFDSSILWSRLGEKEKAFAALEILLEQPSSLSPQMLALDPRWKDLRGDPRFRSLTEG